jgi:MFS family permease
VQAGTRADTSAEASADRPARWLWNFSVFGGDIAFFTLGLNISAAYTILPLFVHRLQVGNVAVALIPAVRALGVFGPQMVLAPLTERLRRAKPLILAITVFERVPFLVLAFASLWLAETYSALLLALFFLMLFVHVFAGGLCYPAWLDLIARAIPGQWRGRFFGWWIGAGDLLGIGGAALAAAIVARVAWPFSFSLIFALTFAAFIVSFVLLSLGREPARPAVVLPARATTAGDPLGARRGAMGWVAQLREFARLARGDRGLLGLMAANAAAGVATMGAALFALSALGQGGLSAPEVSAESTVLAVATALGSLLSGEVGDRLGHRALLVGSAVSMGGAAALALGARGFLAYAVVFLLLGLSVSAGGLSQLTSIAEFAPPQRRPTYIAITSVVYAPFAIGAPILGGWLADRWGYAPAYVLSVLAAGAAVAAYYLWVPALRAGLSRGGRSD